MSVLIVCLLLVLACACAYFAWRNYTTRNLIATTPTSAVAEVRRGLVELQGHVAAADMVLQAPMSGRDCVYYRFTVQQRRARHSGSRASNSWATVVNDSQAVDCLLVDDSGAAEIALPLAKVVLDPDVRQQSGFLSDAPPELERMLQERYGRSSKGWVFNKTMRYTETLLEPGDRLYVLGAAERHGDIVRITAAGPVFLVSDKGERAMASRYLWFTIGLALATTAALVGLVLFLVRR